MHKTIKLKMLENKNIQIYVDGELKLTIKSDNRVLNGDVIYNIFSYSDGNKYKVNIENEYEVDNDALVELQSLFESIAKGIDGLQTVEEQKESTENKIRLSKEENLPL